MGIGRPHAWMVPAREVDKRLPAPSEIEGHGVVVGAGVRDEQAVARRDVAGESQAFEEIVFEAGSAAEPVRSVADALPPVVAPGEHACGYSCICGQSE